jgi:hypothetical protein
VANGDAIVNPYAPETDRNVLDWRDEDGHVTYDAWTAGEKTVDFNAQGLSSYMNNVVTLGDNLRGHLTALTPIAELSSEAFGTGSYREGLILRGKMASSYQELSQYLQYLIAAHQNIAMSVQTIKDSLGDVDDLGAVSLNAVDFAYTQPGAQRPAGLPDQLGQTWQQAYDQAQADAAGTPASTPQDGQQTSTVTVCAPDGGATATTRTTTWPADKPDKRSTSTREVHTVTDHGTTTTTTTDRGTTGAPSDQTVSTVASDGSTSRTQTGYDHGKPVPGTTVVTGPEAPVPDLPLSPLVQLP